MNCINPGEHYRLLAGKYEQSMEKAERLSRQVSWMRLILFISSLVAGYLVFGIHPGGGIAVFCLLSGFFLFAVFMSWKLHREITRYSRLLQICRAEQRALEWDYRSFRDGSEYMDTNHPYSFDIDLFGPGSLFQFLNRTVTNAGRNKLGRMLGFPVTDKERILQLQDAVKELSGALDWRHEFLLAGMEYTETGEDEDQLDAWLREGRVFLGNRLLNLLRYLLPLVTFAVVVLVFLSLLPASAILIFALFQLGIVGVVKYKEINLLYWKVGRRYPILSKLGKLMERIEGYRFSSPLLGGLRENLGTGHESSASVINRLGKTVNSFDHRNNMLAGILLNAFLLWDLHCVFRIEAWHKKYSHLMPEWIRVIGEFDALVSLGNYAFNNTGVLYPSVADQDPVISACAMGHPLIMPGERVNNDFTIEKKGFLVILTGANMAGKSTFLRTLGVNLVLGMNGAPVCAGEFCFTPMKIISSMRTSDSLARNESYFYAEIKRLRRILDEAEASDRVFILLDELLKGTNSADREKGSRLILSQLLALRSTGVVATHDLSLTTMEEDHPGRIRNLCFEVEIDHDRIYFDYKLREGVTRLMNATALMQKLGIVPHPEK